MINAAREMNPSSLVLCSIRDLAHEPNYRQVDERYRQEVRTLLKQYFDGILVHSDERFARLEDSLAWADTIPIPLTYTGFVAEGLTPKADASTGASADVKPGPILVSGGGRRDADLYEACAKAWHELKRRGSTGGREMILIAPAGISPDSILTTTEQRFIDDLRVEPFSPSLADRLPGAGLSVSHAGYNTCTNILTTNVRSILIPHRNSADQMQRAQRFEQLGLSRVIREDALQPERIADAIEQQLMSPRPRHDFRLDGAEQSVYFMENWTTNQSAEAAKDTKA